MGKRGRPKKKEDEGYPIDKYKYQTIPKSNLVRQQNKTMSDRLTKAYLKIYTNAFGLKEFSHGDKKRVERSIAQVLEMI